MTHLLPGKRPRPIEVDVDGAQRRVEMLGERLAVVADDTDSGTFLEPVAMLPETPAQACTGPRRCRRCNARLRSGNRSDICSPCEGAIYGRPGETDGEEDSDCAVLLTPARPKDVVDYADPEDKRPTCTIVAECELDGWEYEEPPYGEKLGIGFKMIAGVPVRL